MRRDIAMAVLFSVLSAPAVAASGPRQERPSLALADGSQAPPAVPDHSVTGVVKAVGRTTLVITRAGKVPAEMTFRLTASTVREGAIAVGTQVQVRFRTGHPPVATAILATPPSRRR
jgi:hypothetical protein